MRLYKLKDDDGEIVVVAGLQHFSLKQIADSGQCFRITVLPVPDGIKESYSVCWGEHHVRVDATDTPEQFVFHCTEDEFRQTWYRYFCLDYDWHPLVQSGAVANTDTFLTNAIQYGGGIRILNQGLWETLICFMISQNNNIKRIAKSVDLICQKYGMRKCDRGIEYYTFPSPPALIGADFSNLGLGYREAYFNELFLPNHASDFANWFIKVHTADSYETAKQLLMMTKGIGNKVADCVCLYGLQHFEAYPIDTWMKKLIDDVYGGHFDTTPYASCAGYVQQLQFYYYRSLKKTKQGGC